MYKVLILGSGNIGFTVALMLSQHKDYEVTLASRNADFLKQCSSSLQIKTEQFNLQQSKKKLEFFSKFDTVISALPYYLNIKVAKLALKAGINYFDFTEDVETTKAIEKLAKKSKNNQVFVPQCGLAPGFISILAYDLYKQFDEVYSIKMRVGALPINPSNKILYNLTWSTDGLINEYCNEGYALKDGVLITTQPMEGLEKFSLDGLEYEAFNTSGGLGTLCQTLLGKVKELNYKTIRYQGHKAYMEFLINDLYLGKKERRFVLKDILEYAIPTTKQDVVLIFCSVTGLRNKKLEQITDVRKIYNQTLYEHSLSSIQITTASGLCAVLDLIANNPKKYQGFVKQESISLHAFLNNHFSKAYNVKEL